MIRFTVAWPPSVLRPNSARRRHYHANATAAALYKSVVALELQEQGVKDVASLIQPGPIAVTLRFCPPRRGRMDRSGSLAAFKSGEDALAEALGIDDDDFEPITLCRGDVRKGGCVEITLHDGCEP